MSQPTTVILRAHDTHSRIRLVPLIVTLHIACGVGLGRAGDESRDARPVGSPVYLMLVSSPPVQEDIELSDEQKGEIAGLAQTYMRSAYEFHCHMLEMLNLPDFSQQDRMQVSRDMRMKLAGLADEIDKQALAVLEPSQHKRLSQLRLRLMGAAILLDPRLRERLKVSDTQLKLLTEAFAARGKACQEYMAEAKKNSSSNQQEMKARVDEIRNDAWSDMQRIFTATQMRILRDLLGPKPVFKADEVKLRLSLKVR